VIAFEKASPPGNIILSPTCKPEIDLTMDVSRKLIPVILIDRMEYSLGILPVSRARSSGSTEVGCVVSI
jgi:hypothetical protein